MPSSILEGNENTRVDLGDDLLEKTAVMEVFDTPKAAPPRTPEPRSFKKAKSGVGSSADPLRSIEEVADRLESAKILESEGLLDQAKAALRAVLIFDRGNRIASEHLERIHQLELQALLGLAEGNEGEAPRRIRPSGLVPLPSGALEVSELENLEGKESGVQQGGELARAWVEALRGGSEEQRMDFSVSLLAMGMESSALELLQTLFSSLKHGVAARVLWGQAAFLSGDVREAELHLTGLLSEAGLVDLFRLDAIYWLSRCKLSRGLREEAISLLSGLFEVDPHFRDVAIRIQEISAELKEQQRKKVRQRFWKSEEDGGSGG